MYQYEYPRPSVTADCVVFSRQDNRLYVLLICRQNEPYKGHWAFPGGFMEMDETIEQCALRELREETGLCLPSARQFYTFSAVDRDPRGRTLSVGHWAVVDSCLPIKGGDDAAEARWFPIDALPPLAFDHQEMLQRALTQLENY